MRKKIFTFLFAALASVGTMFAYDGNPSGFTNSLDWRLNIEDSTLIFTPRDDSKKTTSIENYDMYNNKSPWYSWRNDVKHIIFPDNLTSIGSCAFYDFRQLVDLYIPKSCSRIGDRAFYTCSNIKGVYITDLEAWCNINFPLSSNSDILDYGTNPLCYAKHLYLNGEIVTEVKGVSKVGRSMAFCKDLVRVELPNDITTIDAYAFYRCENLEYIELPQTIQSIGGKAFYWCYSLTSINVPKTASVYSDAFYKVPNVEYHGTNSAAPWGARCLNGYIDNYIVYSDAEKSNLVVCSRAAKGHIAISDKVTTFGDEAFEDCKGITSIDIPKSVLDVPENAFKGCTNLVDIYWNVKRAHDYSGATPFCYMRAGGDGEFDSRQNIKTFTFGENVEYIPSSLCGGMKNLETVTFKGKIDTIASWEFSGCNNLKRINIPDMESWYNLNFMNSNSNPLYYSGSLWINDSEITEVTIPNTVTKIKPYAFYGGATLRSIIIPEGVDSIMEMAFCNCTGTSTIEIPNSVKYISNYAFADVPNISIQSDLKDSPKAPWGARCLNGYMDGYLVYKDPTKTDLQVCATSAVGKINVPNTVDIIAPHAFYNCTNLTSIKLPMSIDSIGYYAFYYVPNIEYEGSLTDKNIWGARSLNGYIEDNLIYSNSTKELLLACPSSVKGKVTIPSVVDSIGRFAFESCKGITNLFLKPNTPPELGTAALSGLNSNVIINTYNKNVNKYLHHDSWNGRYSYKIQSAFSLTEPAQYSTSANIMIICDACDKNIIASCGIVGGEEFAGNMVDVINLEPDSVYKNVPFFLKTSEGEYDTLLYSYRTTELTLTTKESKPVSSTTAILLAETNMSDAETNCGFEYKRNDAPEDFTPTKVYCPVSSGTMAGRLKNLKDDVYYKYRAFYQSAAGNMYYGEWKYIFTGDVTVDFDPILYTYAPVVVSENKAILKGYALAGSEDFTEQGFEYWAESRVPKADAPLRMPAALGEHSFVKASGISMSVTLDNLDAGTVYKYRVYAKAGDQVLYGPEQSFTTQGEYIDETTAIEEIQSIDKAVPQAQKVLRNGHLLILSGDKIYTITGQEVK